ncbi:uncharacterized protein CEXT_439811 [Caerostris extrusa]|uniref:Uncharacterized protein n=1 Tax=Caerostris extrusa TaxID=172846 RepID=A0AAV4XZE1_CAEEX|nr:uncharacterized protein CEXT_439811 [Caerostris extrusa]
MRVRAKRVGVIQLAHFEGSIYTQTNRFIIDSHVNASLPEVNSRCLSKSGSQSVFLRHVDLDSAGTYRCEVSAEAPEFQTVEAEKEMKVLVLPTEGPRIMGGLPKYRVGDTVFVNCTSSSPNLQQL